MNWPQAVAVCGVMGGFASVAWAFCWIVVRLAEIEKGDDDE